jgi:hypothetical protein
VKHAAFKAGLRADLLNCDKSGGAARQLYQSRRMLYAARRLHKDPRLCRFADLKRAYLCAAAGTSSAQARKMYQRVFCSLSGKSLSRSGLTGHSG